MDHHRILTSLKGVNTNEMNDPILRELTTTLTTNNGNNSTINNLRLSTSSGNTLSISQNRVINSLHHLQLQQSDQLLQQIPIHNSNNNNNNNNNKTTPLPIVTPTTIPTIINQLSKSSACSLSTSNYLCQNRDKTKIIRNINFLKNSVENFFTSNSSVYQEGSSSFNINDFPEEILIHILKYLSPFDLRICCIVSHYWSIISSQNPIWYDKCQGQWHWCCNITNEKEIFDKSLNINHSNKNDSDNDDNQLLLGRQQIKYYKKSNWKEFYRYWAKEYLNSMEWWQQSFTRDDANKVLSTMGKGTFLIRGSTSKKNCLVISYNVHAQTPNHMLLSYLGLYTGVSLYDEIGRVYPTLASLIRGKKSWLKRPFQASHVYTLKSNEKQRYIEKLIKEKANNTLINELALLHIACKWSFKSCVAKLLEMGADINYRCTLKKGKPPLFFAIGFVHGQPQSSVRLEIVKMLLEHQHLIINQLDLKGRSICHIACKQHQQDSLDILKLLLKCGANPHLSAPNGHYPLHIAVKENNLKMIKVLLSNSGNGGIISDTSSDSSNGSNEDNNSNNSNNSNDNNISKLKININCIIESTPISRLNDDYGTTPLHLAASKNLCPIIKLILEQPDIDIDQRDNKQRTALHRSVSNTQDWVNMARFGKPLQHHYSHQVIEMLLKSNSDPNLFDIENKTPLHIAIEKGHRKSTYIIATRLRESYSKQFIQSNYTRESLFNSLKQGSESKDIQKIVADVNYSIMCGYNEDFIEPLDKTIIDHYNNINDILKKEFLNLLN